MPIGEAVEVNTAVEIGIGQRDGIGMERSDDIGLAGRGSAPGRNIRTFQQQSSKKQSQMDGRLSYHLMNYPKNGSSASV